MKRTDRKYFTGFLRLVLSVLLLSTLAVTVSATTGPGYMLREGVVVDPSRGLAYVMVPAGGIAALELASGSVVWSTDAADRPLALIDGMLIAQSDGVPGKGLPLVTVDPAAGLVRSSTEIPLPKGVHNRVDDGIHRSLRVSASPSVGGAAIAWKAVQAPASGILAGPQEGLAPGTTEALAVGKASPLRTFEGTARLDLVTGAVTALPAKAARLSVASLSELRLGEGIAGAEGRQFLSIDGRHILVSTRLERPTPNALYRWTIYHRASGTERGGFDHSVSAAPFFVVGGQLIFETRPTLFAKGGADEPWERTSLELRSMDLLNGVPTWKVALRDTTFQGPFPP